MTEGAWGWNPGDPKHLDALYRDWWLLLNTDAVDEIHYLVQAGMPPLEQQAGIQAVMNDIRAAIRAEADRLESINEFVKAAIMRRKDIRVYISCRGKMVICDRDLQHTLLELDADDRRFDSGIQSRACLVGSRMVCFGSNNERLWCFDRHTGELLETIDFRDFVICNPILDGERLYVCCLDGTVTCYDASEYID